MRVSYHVMSAPAPLGLLFLARTDRGLRWLEFMDRRSIKRTIASHAEALPGAIWEPSLLDLKPVADQLEAYFCGQLTRFDIPLDLEGSSFQLAAWHALTEIPYGETRTYGQIAKAVRQPKAARAVGLANNQNPIPIVVPCHRVIGADGSLTGYGGGLPRKRWLLQMEARFNALPLFDQTVSMTSDRPAAIAEDRAAVATARVPATRGHTPAARAHATRSHAPAARRHAPAAKTVARRSR